MFQVRQCISFDTLQELNQDKIIVSSSHGNTDSFQNSRYGTKTTLNSHLYSRSGLLKVMMQMLLLDLLATVEWAGPMAVN